MVLQLKFKPIRLRGSRVMIGHLKYLYNCKNKRLKISKIKNINSKIKLNFRSKRIFKKVIV